MGFNSRHDSVARALAFGLEVYVCSAYGGNIGALIIGIGFWDPLYYNYNRELLKQYR